MIKLLSWSKFWVFSGGLITGFALKDIYAEAANAGWVRYAMVAMLYLASVLLFCMREGR